ncbi:hypothetical protein CO667_17300 [Rhizobium sp. L43]|nr:hypothetical protein CO667_17300 [Rhizobium sp. L43]
MLVTGIQPRRVGAVNESILQRKESFAPKDLGALDSCDEHRNEGGMCGSTWFPIATSEPSCRHRTFLK